MKKFRLFKILSIFAIAAAGAVAVGVGTKAPKVEAAEAANTTVYCKMTYGWWTADGAAIGVYYWGGTSSGTTWPGVRGTAVPTDTGVWKFSVPADITGLIFTRVNGSGDVADWGAQTKNLSLEVNKLYTITSSSAVWGSSGVDGSWSSGTYYEVPVDLSLTIYASSADYQTSKVPNIYYWGDCVVSAPSYPGNPMTSTTKDVSYQGSSLYKYTIEYQSRFSDRSDVSISMILNNDGDSNKTSNIDIIMDGYYYCPSDGHKWYNGVSSDAKKGAAAAVAFELDKDICSLSKTKADSLRDDMETYEDELSTATWNGYSYTNAYELVDSQCSTPKLAIRPLISNLFGESESPVLILVIISLVSVSAVVGLFFIRKRKHI